MIDKIKTLLNKTNELEEKINLLSNNQNNYNIANNFICFCHKYNLLLLFYSSFLLTFTLAHLNTLSLYM